MAEAPAYKEWILEAIDQLRKRKARPDLERICHMLERRHGAASALVQEQLQTLVLSQVVVKVDYKGSTSYRNAAKWIKTVGRNAAATAGQMQAASDVTACTVGQTLRRLKNGGAPIRDISEKQQLTGDSIEPVTPDQPDSTSGRDVPVPSGKIRKSSELVLPLQQQHSEQQTTDLGRDNKVGVLAVEEADEDNGFVGQKGFAEIKLKDKDSSKKAKDVETASRRPRDVEERRSEFPLRPKRAASPLPLGRPASRRKRVKKYHGPDFIDSSSLPSPERLDNDDPLCDLCFLSSTYNLKGQAEDLLRCTDCNAKAHPSCMEYSAELGKRCHLNSWQCMDCKPCSLCKTPGNGDCMVFCDSCDRGYHIKCHKPKVPEKPTGKWLCYKCSPECKGLTGPTVSTSTTSASLPTTSTTPQRGRPRRIPKPPTPVAVEVSPAAACLPTPCDSPVSDLDSSPECDDKSNAIANGKEIAQYPESVPDAKDWTIHDVVQFFTALGFPDQAPAFKDQEIDGKSLLLMKRSDVLTGLSIRLGPALKIYNHIKRLQTGLPDGHLAVH